MKSWLAPTLLLATLACAGAADGDPALVPGSGGEPQSPVPETQLVPQKQPVAEKQPFAEALPVAAAQQGPQKQPSLPAAEPSPAPLPAEPETTKSERDPGTPAGDAKRNLWQSKAPSSYVVTTCGYGFTLPACSLQAVKDGHLVASENRFLSQDPWQPTTDSPDQDPFESLFAQLQSPPSGCRTSYEIDPVYAYPSQVYFDCGSEGWGTRVTCFEPDTLNLDECRK